MPKIVPEYWGTRVKSLKGENPNWGAGRIAGELQREAERYDWMDAPSERWVGNFLRNVWNKMMEEERRQYSLFSWPQSMEAGLLPWEASASSLELLDIRREVELLSSALDEKTEKILEPLRGMRWSRTSVRLARWFWRLTQAVPDLPAVSEVLQFPPHNDIPGRYDIALVLADWGTGADAPQWLRDGIETYLSYAPWRSPQRALSYKRKVEYGEIPGLNQEDVLGFSRPDI